MKTFKYLSALTLAFILAATSFIAAVDSVGRESGASSSTALDRAEAALAAERARAADAATDATASMNRAADRAENSLNADRAAAAAAVNRAAADSAYAVDQTVARAENAARSAVPWLIGAALVIGILYLVSRRSRIPHVPPIDRDAAIPPVSPRRATNTYPHP